MKKGHLKKRYKFLIAFLILICILLFAAPRVARWYIVKHSHELIGRRLEIEKIRINYFTGTLRIYGANLYESDQKSTFVSFKLFKVHLAYLPLFRNEIFIKDISLDDAFAEVLQDNDKFNFSDLTKTDTTTAKKDTVSSKPMKYIINNIKINRGYIKYTDIAMNHTIALDRLDLLIPGFTWNSDSTNLDVNFRFVDGGGLYSSLALNQADSTYSVNLKLDSLNLKIIEPYVQNNFRISAMQGYLSNDLRIRGNMRSVMQLNVSGINHVFDFSMTDTLSRKILSFKEATVDINTIQPDKNKVNLNLVSLTDPYVLVEMIDSTNNWSALMKPSSTQAADTTKQKTDSTTVSPSGSYTFSKFAITGGKILFSDKTLRYPFEYTLDNVNVESTPVKGNTDKLAFTIGAGLNGTGSLAMKLTMNPSKYDDMDLALSIGQFRMKDMDAYFKHYFGFPVTGGIMNFKTDNKLRPESLTSDNSLYFRKFTLAKSLKTKVEYHIPLRLALGILSDKDGIIDLKAPIESKGKDVKVRYLGRIILKIIGNLFIKAAVSPFNLFSSAYNVDPATLHDIRLDLMEAAPDEKSLKSVDIISDILNKKPALNIDFFYCSDHSKAVDSLAYLLTKDEYLKNHSAHGEMSAGIPDSILIGFLRSRLSADVVKIDSGLRGLCRNYIGTKQVENRLDSIKSLQISFLTNYLSHDKGIQSNRFRIIPVAPDTIKPAGNYPSFRTYFTEGGENQE
jgi:hypothetical protein